MSTETRIDLGGKKKAEILFPHSDVPMADEVPHYNSETLAAMEAARRISRNPHVPSYDNMEDLKRELEK